MTKTDASATANAKADANGSGNGSNSGYPDNWLPNPGDTLRAKFMRVEEGYASGMYGGDCPIVILMDSNAKMWSFWLWGAAVRNQFMKLKPQHGDILTITYNGKRESKAGGKSYHHYTILTDSPRGESWSDLARKYGGASDQAQAPTGRTAQAMDDWARRMKDDEDIPF